ncbi:MAG: response regulator, partial [Clostridia bacterium]
MITVLIVDDEPHIVQGIATLLREELAEDAPQILTSSSPAQAQGLLDTQPVQLLISDLKMPGISGTDLIHHARLRNPACYFILLTAYREFDAAYTLDKYEGGCYLLKTEADDVLVSRVRSYCAQIRAEQLRSCMETEIPWSSSTDPAIRRIEQALAQQPGTLGLTELAAKLNMNASYLSRYYKQETGRNLLTFRNTLRLRQACELLRDTDQSL